MVEQGFVKRSNGFHYLGYLIPQESNLLSTKDSTDNIHSLIHTHSSNLMGCAERHVGMGSHQLAMAVTSPRSGNGLMMTWRVKPSPVLFPLGIE